MNNTIMNNTWCRSMAWGRCLAAGAGAAVAAFAATWAVRRASLRWGTSDGELEMPLPGDDYIPAPDLQATRAITINGPSSQVWPWVAQLGQNRGGFYTYDWLENLAGCDIHTSNVIVPELRLRAVGDEVRLAPSAALQVVALEEGHHFVLRGAVAADGTNAPAPYDFTWAFVLIGGAVGTTRLIVRERYAYLASWAGLLAEPVEMVSFLMSQRMLRGIRERAERRTANGV
jgi:hypothetical protein